MARRKLKESIRKTKEDIDINEARQALSNEIMNHIFESPNQDGMQLFLSGDDGNAKE